MPENPSATGLRHHPTFLLHFPLRLPVSAAPAGEANRKPHNGYHHTPLHENPTSQP